MSINIIIDGMVNAEHDTIDTAGTAHPDKKT